MVDLFVFTIFVGKYQDDETYYYKVKEITMNIPADGDPYGVNRAIIEKGDMDVVNISVTPALYFSSMTYTFFQPGIGSHWPLMNVGKIVIREGRKVAPVGIYVDHAFVDGSDISEFVEKAQQYLDMPLLMDELVNI